MGERGPNSNKPNLTIVKPVIKRPPPPLKGMHPKERAIWVKVVSAYPADRFKPPHYDLLRMYCEACVMQKESMEEIKKGSKLIKQKNGVIKENPYFGISEKMAARATALATKLGITVNSTLEARGKGCEPIKQKGQRGDLLYGGK